METSPAIGRSRLRKCCHCHEFYPPDYRNRRHQKYCTKPECHQASKKAAQHRWLVSSKGDGYFKGPENAARVQAWRAAHPEYWKRAGSKHNDTLQDVLSSQNSDKKGDTKVSTGTALQDICFLQPALLVGLIANLTGSPLQDDIAETTHRFIVSGRDILGCDP